MDTDKQTQETQLTLLLNLTHDLKQAQEDNEKLRKNNVDLVDTVVAMLTECGIDFSDIDEAERKAKSIASKPSLIVRATLENARKATEQAIKYTSLSISPANDKYGKPDTIEASLNSESADWKHADKWPELAEAIKRYEKQPL